MVDTPIYVGTKNEGIPGSSVTKNPPALQELQETQVRSLGWEDSLKEEMARILEYSWNTPVFMEESHGQRSLSGYSS